MKLSDVVYPLTRPNVIWAISVYLKKIFYSNEDRLPMDRPMLIVSNHPTAFLEPVVYSGLLKKPIHSLVRGDFFQDKLARTGLESLNMIEIYRMQDGGREGVRKNAQTFQHCYDLIAQGEQVLIMAEGFTTQQKRLSPLLNGAARLALGAATSKKLEDMVVLPIGANFTEANQFRSELMVEVGQPIELKDYLSSYKANKKQCVTQLTADITAAMRSTLVHVDDPADDALFERVAPIIRRQVPYSIWPDWNYSEDRFKAEQNLAQYINQAGPEEKRALVAKVDQYPEGISDRPFYPLATAIILILAFPQWLVGKIYRFLPFIYPRHIVKTKVEEIEFESPIRFGFGALAIIIWTIVLTLLIGVVIGWDKAWWPFAMLFVVWVSFIYEDLWAKWKGAMAWFRLSKNEKSAALQIENDLESLIQRT